MQSGVAAQVPVLYVADADAARRFYEIFGYTEIRAGGDGGSRWSYLRCGELTLLLAAVTPAWSPSSCPYSSTCTWTT